MKRNPPLQPPKKSGPPRRGGPGGPKRPTGPGRGGPSQGRSGPRTGGSPDRGAGRDAERGDAKPRFYKGDDSRAERPRGERPARAERPERPAFAKKVREARTPDEGKSTFRIEVGYDHGVKPGNIVGAIANEAGLDAKHIGRIEIFEDHTLLDLPDGMPADVMTHLKTVWCAGQQLRITRDGETPDTAGKVAGKKPFGGKAPFAGGKKEFGPRKFGGDKPAFKKPHRKGPAND